MKILVTGVKGQLGHDVVEELKKRGLEAVGIDIGELDITDEAAVRQYMQGCRPDALIHCAAWTAVDAAEDEDKRALVMRVNADGTEYLAESCRLLDIPMMYISTDYVFSGQGLKPWGADCQDFAPLNVYGESKLLGEEAVRSRLSRYFIVRIAWVFGLNGGNFIKTMLKVGENRDELKVVNDQIGTPTYTYDLARLLVDMIQSDKYGHYHATNEGGYISWYDFASEIFRQAAALGHDSYDAGHLSVLPVSTSEYGLSKAARPFNSRLDKSKLREAGFEPLPDWKDALARYLKALGL